MAVTWATRYTAGPQTTLTCKGPQTCFNSLCVQYPAPAPLSDLGPSIIGRSEGSLGHNSVLRVSGYSPADWAHLFPFIQLGHHLRENFSSPDGSPPSLVPQ